MHEPVKIYIGMHIGAITINRTADNPTPPQYVKTLWMKSKLCPPLIMPSPVVEVTIVPIAGVSSNIKLWSPIKMVDTPLIWFIQCGDGQVSFHYICISLHYLTAALKPTTNQMGFHDSGWKSDMLTQMDWPVEKRPLGVYIRIDGGLRGYSWGKRSSPNSNDWDIQSELRYQPKSHKPHKLWTTRDIISTPFSPW